MLTRRAMLTSTPTLPLAVAVPRPSSRLARCRSTGRPATISALFALLAGYNALQDAVLQAKAGLEWLANEWRHLWPRAPQELFWSAGQKKKTSVRNGTRGEVDMAGRYILRDQ